MGNWGEYPGNCHRDFLQQFNHANGLTKAFELQVPVRDPKTSKPSMETASLFLPHLLFADLAGSYPEEFSKLFGTDKNEAFWQNVAAIRDERLEGHPICRDRAGIGHRRVVNPSQVLPLFLHCDGVEFQTRDTILTWNFGGFLSLENSLAAHLLICAFPKSCTTEETWTPIMKYIQWSLESLQDGLHPAVGPDNEPLPKGSLFERLAGQPLSSQGYRAVLWSIQGDHEMYANTLRLGHWTSQFPCWECNCQQPLTKGVPCPPGLSFKLLREEEQMFQIVTHAEALSKGSTHTLFTIPGLSTKMVRHDGLHVLFCRGVCSHLCGSILHYLCYLEGKGRQRVPLVRDSP